MNLDSKTRRITETAVITTLAAVFVIIGLTILPIVTLLYPVPFVILSVRHGVKYNVLSIIASSLIVAILIDVLTALLVFLIFGILAIGLGYMMSKKYKPSQILIVNTLVSLVATLLAINIIGYITGIEFINQIDTSFSEALRLQIEMMQDMGLSKYEMSQLQGLLRTVTDLIIIIIPATIIISAALNAYINYLVSGAILRRLGHSSIETPRFIYFKLPSNIIFGTAVIFLGTMILRYFEFFYHDTIFINIALIVTFVFLIQGLAVSVYLMEKVKLNKILKGILIVLMIINIPFSIGISLVGLLDVIFDFRKLKRT